MTGNNEHTPNDNPTRDLFLEGGGRMGRRSREFDWARTRLGAGAEWPQSLKTSASIVLNSACPMMLWWGEDLLCLYNDAAATLLGRRDDVALGHPASEVLADLWPVLGPRAHKVFEDGHPVAGIEMSLQTAEGKRSVIFSLSLVSGEGDGTPGLFCNISPSSALPDSIIAQEAQAQGNSRYALLSLAMDATQAGWAVWDWRTGMVEWSDSARQIMGLPNDAETHTIEHWLEQIHPDDRDRVQTHALDSKDSHRDFNLEYRITRPDGAIRHVLGLGRIVYSDADLPIHSTGLILDVTERKRIEEALQAAAARDAFRVRLNDALRPLGDPHEIKQTTTRVITEFLQVSRALYGEVDDALDVRIVADHSPNPDAPSMKGVYQLAEFGEAIPRAFRTGRTIVATDVLNSGFSDEEKAAYLRIQTESHISVPLVKDGRPVAVFAIHQTTPRIWTDEEVALVEEVAERTWAAVEKARALKKLSTNERRLTAILEQLPLGVGVLDLNARFLISNSTMRALVPEVMPSRDKTHQHRWQAHDPAGRPIPPEYWPGTQALRGIAVSPGLEFTYLDEEGKKFWKQISSVPFRGDDGEIIGALVVSQDITDRKVAEEAVRRSEATFRKLAESNIIGVAMGDDKGNITYLNDEMLRMMGYSREDFNAGRINWVETITPEFRDAAANHGKMVLIKGRIEGYERAFLRPDGGRTHFLGAAAIVSPGSREHVSIALDLTKVQLAEKALRRSEERFRKIFEKAATGIAIANLEGNILQVNPNFARLVGYTEEEISGMNLRELIHPEDVTENMHQFERLKENKIHFFELENRYIDKNRKEIWVRKYVSLLRNDNGQPDQILALVTDATERRRVEQVLRESEQRFRAMADNLPHIVWVHDAQGRQEFVNETFREYFGVTREMLNGNRWELILHPYDKLSYLKAFSRSIHEQTPFHHETRVKNRHDEWRWLESWAKPRFDDNGNYLGCVGTSADITDRKNAEEALREADQRKDQFLATLAHELRNPLAPLHNGLQLMLAAPDDTNLREKARGMMERQLAQMVRLIDDLLDVSRITRGKLNLRIETVVLQNVLREVAESLHPLLEESELDFSMELSPDPIEINADETRLSQIFANLLNNAAKYTYPGGRIRVDLERRAYEAVVIVTDTGIGISEEKKNEIFELFTQGDSSHHRKHGGLGIGLSLARQLVQMHGGTLSVESAGIGKGSRFIVRLPVPASNKWEEPDTANPQPAVGEIPDNQNTAATEKRKVLVVDDNHDAADSLAMLLRIMGLETRTAYDGFQALEIAGDFRPAIILLDLGMPGLNGIDTARRLRKEPWGRDIFLVALTGWGQDSDKAKTRQAGFDSHLTKPVDPATLQKILESPLQR